MKRNLIVLLTILVCSLTACKPGQKKEEDMEKETKLKIETKITSIRVETYGVDYGEPETIEPFNYYNWLMKQYSTTQSSND